MSHSEAVSKLRSAQWLRAPATQKVFELLDGEWDRTRAVGGVVRDTLLGRLNRNTDVDFATELMPDEVSSRAREAGIACIPTGFEHGTVTLRVDGQSFEVTTLREDVETDGRRAKVAFGTDWVRDAERRDFTLNAIYARMDGELYDPLGGLGDCLAGKVRFIGDADRRIAEDKLRVYRFFRFTASHGDQNFDRPGLAACKRAADDMSGISNERIGVEMMRMLELPHIAKTLRTMSRNGIFSINREAMRQLVHYDRCSDMPLAAGRIAILLDAHDADEIQGMWRLSNAEIKAAIALRDAAHLLQEGQVNEVAYRFADIAKTAIDVAAAVSDWSEDFQEEMHAIIRATRVPSFPIKGQDLLNEGIKPGAALGRKLHSLERDWIDSGFQLTREELLNRVKMY